MHINRQQCLARILLAGVLALPCIALAARSDWRELVVGHFELFSTLSDSGTRNVALQLQAFEQTLGEMLQTGDRLPDIPTRIYLLSDRDFNRYAAFRPGLEDPPVEAVELWATAVWRTGGNPAQIVAALEPLLVRVPHDTAALRSLARGYEALGDKAKAREAYNQIILVSRSSDERHWAQLQADSVRFQESRTISMPCSRA
jgi:hypothetical protein